MRAVFSGQWRKSTSPPIPRAMSCEIKTASLGYHSWTPEEVEKFERCHVIGTRPRLALALLLYTRVRRSDVVLLGKQHLRDGWLNFSSTRTAIGIRCSSTTPPARAATHHRCKRDRRSDISMTDYGRPFTAAGFGIRFASGATGPAPHCTAHGRGRLELQLRQRTARLSTSSCPSSAGRRSRKPSATRRRRVGKRWRVTRCRYS